MNLMIIIQILVFKCQLIKRNNWFFLFVSQSLYFIYEDKTNARNRLTKWNKNTSLFKISGQKLKQTKVYATEYHIYIPQSMRFCMVA